MSKTEIEAHQVTDERTKERFISYAATKSFEVDGIVYKPPIVFDRRHREFVMNWNRYPNGRRYHPGPMISVKYD